MTDNNNNNSSIPVDLRIKRKRIDIDGEKVLTKKKSRHHTNNEIPLDLSIKSSSSSSSLSNPIFNPTSSNNLTPTPFYDPTNLLFNSSALLYDLFLANINAYCQQQQQQRSKVEVSPPSVIPKPAKSSPNQSRSMKDSLISPSTTTTSKQESYACSCGEKYSGVAQLVSHLKITNHNAQLSSTHDDVAKLVRGQDIWLSRDTNPANQILKCLRCSLSFETLPDLTAHMMKTNHFTQLLPSSSSSSYHSTSKQPPPQQASPPKSSPVSLNPIRSTCLVCSQQFAREVDLVDHIQRIHQIRYNCTTCGMYFESEHTYKEHILKEMHHRNGKANRNRDYFLNQCKVLATMQKRTTTINENKSERTKSRSPIEQEVERVAKDLIDRIIPKFEPVDDVLPVVGNSGNALSLLQNFVIKQTPSSTSTVSSTKLSSSSLHRHIDHNNNSNNQHEEKFDDEENSSTSMHEEKSSSRSSPPLSIVTRKSNESPLASLEKMLAYPSTADSSSNEISHATSLSPNSINVIPKKKKFDKYRLFAEKMLRSTLS